MGRKHRRYPDNGPRTTLPANQEQWRANRHGQAPSFGIRRPLTLPSSDKIVGLLFDLQEQGIIPDEPKCEVRDSPAITMISRRAVGLVLQRGGADYDLEVARSAMAGSSGCNRRDETLAVRLGKVKPLGRTILYATVESSVVKREIIAANSALAVAGLRPMAKKAREIEPHVTLVNAGRGRAFSGEDLATMTAVLERVLPREVEVEPWDSYPFELFEDEARMPHEWTVLDELQRCTYVQPGLDAS